MKRPATPGLSGRCICRQEVPAEPAGAPYEGRVRLAVHDYPRSELGRCIGSRMVTLPVGQLELFTVAEAEREAA